MKPLFLFIAALAGMLCTIGGSAQEAVEEGYTTLFNGKDLTGWEYGPVPVTKKPIIEKLDGKTATKDKVFQVEDGLIAASGKRIMALYTAKEYNQDFTFKLEFRTSTDNKKNNSGIYIRGPQLQLDAVTEGGLTGVFRKIKNFKPGDWNEIEIVVKGTEATCKCNGELIGKAMKVPEKGTIGLQSEIGKFEFRRIRIKTAAATGGATLVEKGQARAVIIVPEKPAPGVESAARVLWDHIKQMSGAELPMCSEAGITGSPSRPHVWVLVGEGKLTEKLGLTSKGLGPGGIVQSARDHVLALFGSDAHTPSDPSGTRYAVTTFLEDKLGVRYLWPGELGKVVPRRETIAVDDYEHRFTPKLGQRRIRSMGYHDRVQVGLDRLGFTKGEYERTIEVRAHTLVADAADKAAAKKTLDERFALMRQIFREAPLALNVAYISWGEDALWSRLGWQPPR